MIEVLREVDLSLINIRIMVKNDMGRRWMGAFGTISEDLAKTKLQLNQIKQSPKKLLCFANPFGCD